MTKNSVTDQITRIRARLKAIERERASLEETDFATRADLIDEEHELQAQLADLIERAGSDDHALAAEQASAGTDLTRTPDLPRT